MDSLGPKKLMPKQLKLVKLENLDIVNEGVVTTSQLRNIYSYSLIWHICKFSHFHLFSFILLKYCVTFAVEFIITTRTHCHAWYRIFVGYSCSLYFKKCRVQWNSSLSLTTIKCTLKLFCEKSSNYESTCKSSAKTRRMCIVHTKKELL